MANQFNQEEIVLFDQVLEKFDSDDSVAMQAKLFTQPGQGLQREGDKVWRPQPMISRVIDGLDVTGDEEDVVQLSVPSSLTTISNVSWELSAIEMRDPTYVDRKSTSAAQGLSARINEAIALNVTQWGTLTVAISDPLSGYTDIAAADAFMINNDVLGAQKTMVLNPFAYNLMGNDLSLRLLLPRSGTALDSTLIGPMSNFNTFKTSFTTGLSAAGGGVTTVSGDQDYVPVSTSTAATGETENVDNRTMNLIVNNTGGVSPGDKFTIASVDALSHINKIDTGERKTFTVIENVDGTTLKIAPPIIVGIGPDAAKEYANVTFPAIDGQPLTWLNTVGTPANIFFMNNSIEVFGGNLEFGDEMIGVATMRKTTKSGVEIIFAKQGDVQTGIETYRFTVFFGVTNLNPEMNGILIGNQGAALEAIATPEEEAILQAKYEAWLLTKVD